MTDECSIAQVLKALEAHHPTAATLTKRTLTTFKEYVKELADGYMRGDVTRYQKIVFGASRFKGEDTKLTADAFGVLSFGSWTRSGRRTFINSKSHNSLHQVIRYGFV